MNEDLIKYRLSRAKETLKDAEILKIPYITINGKQMNPRDIIKPSKFEFEKLLTMKGVSTPTNGWSS